MKKTVTPLLLFCLFLSFCTVPVFGKSYDDKMISSEHKAKKWLDKLFKDRGYPRSKKGFMKLGFRNFTRPDSPGALVFKHRGCKGYLFKLYENKDGTIDEARILANRIKGANTIREYIAQNGYEQYFKVPQKCLYHHKSPSHYILVVEDMRILNREKNLKAWKSSRVTAPLLKALAKTLTELGLIDSIYVDNIPFCKDGKIAFIDTEHYHSSQPVRLELMCHCLPKSLQPLWQSF